MQLRHRMSNASLTLKCFFVLTFLYGAKAQSSTSLVTESEKQQILDVHNRCRDLVASGKVIALGGQRLPPAQNMKKMKWNDNLASAAQAHADLRQFSHSKPFPGRYGTFYGQNLSINMSTGSLGSPNWPGIIIGGWFNEHKYFPISMRERFSMERRYGHFSQMVWANSDQVGCGRRYFSVPGSMFRNRLIYTCNYTPPGNYIGPKGHPINTMYKAGKPCSTCKCDSSYKSLCVS